MRNSKFPVILWLGALTMPACCLAASLPAGAQQGGWASRSVQEVVRNGVMTPVSGKSFQGDALVTRTQAAIALAKLARALETGSWHPSQSAPVTNKVIPTLRQGDWKQRPVTRYALADVLARTADYVANGLPRPDSHANDLGKSLVPQKVTVTVSRANPAYESLTYLASHRMLTPNSPLLKADSAPLRGDELRRAVADMVVGLNDRLTPLGHDAEGNTPDATFHKKRAAGK
jgi:hypothetical protein